MVLTLVELSGLLLVIFVGLWGMTQGRADLSLVVVFESLDDKSVFLAVTAATTLAFFAMVGHPVRGRRAAGGRRAGMSGRRPADRPPCPRSGRTVAPCP